MKASVRGLIPVIGLGVFLLSVAGCEDTSGPSDSVADLPDSGQRPRKSREAEDAALWLSGDLVAPRRLYDQLQFGYETIRAQYGESIPEVRTTPFLAPWVSGELLVKLTIEARERYHRGEYTDLDALNERYGVIEVEPILDEQFGWLSLRFGGRLHPRRLMEIYAEVPSIELVEPNLRLANGRGNYPWPTDDGFTFLFRVGWGDCPAGCFGHQFWYFRLRRDRSPFRDYKLEYVGTAEWHDDPKPAWWDEAMIAYEAMLDSYY